MEQALLGCCEKTKALITGFEAVPPDISHSEIKDPKSLKTGNFPAYLVRQLFLPKSSLWKSLNS
jgi:hypothetical protein